MLGHTLIAPLDLEFISSEFIPFERLSGVLLFIAAVSALAH